MLFRELTAADRVAVQRWPRYPLEFSALDYALRENGWLDEPRDSAKTSCFAIEKSGEIIAFTILSATDTNAAEFRIALRADKIGQGLGAAITSLTLEYGFSQLGLSQIHLIVRKNNVRAHRLYTQMGFIHQGECFQYCNGKQVLFTMMNMMTKRRTK